MIELLITTMYIALFLALSALTWSIVRRMVITRKASGIVNHIPVRRIRILVSILVITTLTLSYALSNTEPIHIGKQIYDEELWLRTANMLVTTGIAVISIATVTIITSIIIKGTIK